MDSFRKNSMLGNWEEENRLKTLENYSYPKRPCDTNCVDGCIARPSCPLYTAWEYQRENDKKKKGG